MTVEEIHFARAVEEETIDRIVCMLQDTANVLGDWPEAKRSARLCTRLSLNIAEHFPRKYGK